MKGALRSCKVQYTVSAEVSTWIHIWQPPVLQCNAAYCQLSGSLAPMPITGTPATVQTHEIEITYTPKPSLRVAPLPPTSGEQKGLTVARNSLSLSTSRT